MCVRVRVIGGLIVLALVLTSAQCVMACAVTSCHDKDLAPCHQGHHSHAPKVPLACSHELGIAPAAHLNNPIADCDFSHAAFAVTEVVPLPIVGTALGLPRRSPSPPGLTSLSAVVLRI